MLRAASAPTTGLEMPRSANDMKLCAPYMCASGRSSSPKTPRSAQRKRNLSGGDLAEPDLNTVAGHHLWPAFEHFLRPDAELGEQRGGVDGRRRLYRPPTLGRCIRSRYPSPPTPSTGVGSSCSK